MGLLAKELLQTSMQMLFVRWKSAVLNGIYFGVVLLISFGIATQALARKVNTYDATKTPLLFSVEKERVLVSNSVAGRVDELPVVAGQHVHKGDLLVRLVDDGLRQRMDSLRSLAGENLSARTELALLEARIPDYEIRATRDGVIYQIQASEGSYLMMNSSVLVLFADNNVRVSGTVNKEQYAEIQKNRDLNVYSQRFEQIYGISFEGVGRVQTTAESGERYEVRFRFQDPDEGAAFIDGESLEVVSNDTRDQAVLPATRVANLWDKLILGR